jgi:hypothetical protein
MKRATVALISSILSSNLLSIMALIFEANGFEVIEQGRVWNTYSLTYLFHLIPLTRVLKEIGLRTEASPFGSLPLTLPLGNLYLIAKKPKASWGPG